MPNTPHTVSFDVHGDAATRVEAHVPARAAARRLARFAYAFARGHVDSVAALVRLVRGAYRQGTHKR